ncbi:MAG TPA: hypothetical protein DEH78_29210, partial [Solibacterales bacterium]|nr:hypothetical protein [Bryobacterales bacterium]
MRKLLLVFVGSLLCGQTFNSRITGTVTDPAGAPVPGAKVVARDIDRNVAKAAATSASGVYTIPLLLPGNHEVTIEAAGFSTQVRKDVLLEANATVTLDFQMQLASVATTVDVTGDVPLLQAETANVGNTIDSKTIDEMPLIQRDVMALVRTMPGVIARDTVGDARGNRNVFNSVFAVGGGRASTNEVLIDGAANTIGDFNGVAIVPPQDSVQEFRVEANSFSAEFGRTGGGVVNMITKGGTNRFRGTAFYYHQNDAFNANSFGNNRFGVRRQVLRRHQYGVSFGGPVVIPGVYKGNDKTFFFTAFEGRDEKDPVNQIFSVPTEAERRGDFSNTVFLGTGGAVPITIYDPWTGRIVGGARQRDPFPGNAIPASRINAVSANVLKEYPAANRPGSTVTNRANYNFTGARSYSRDVISARVDHFFNEKHRLFGRFTWQANEDLFPARVVRFTNTNSTYDSFKNVGLDDTLQLTTRLTLVLRASYARFRANLRSNTLGFDPTSLGFPQYVRERADVLFYPNFSMGGTFPDIGGTAYNNQPRDTQGYQVNMVYVTGRHNMRWGGEFRLYRFYPFQIFNPTGGYSFAANFTQNDHIGPARPEQGMGLASFLLGAGSFTYEHAEALSGFQKYWGGYFQDDWKVTSRLTVNLGLRWETELGMGEASNRIAYFDPAAPSPVPGARGAILFAGRNGAERLTRQNYWRNFGPRLGLAYRLTPKIALRAGYGLFYLPLGLEPAIATTPFNYTLSVNTFDANYRPTVTVDNPFPAGLTPPAAATPPGDGSYRLNNTANVLLRNQPMPYSQQWNFAVGRQLARTTVVDFTYVGNRGVHLPIPSIELNQIDPKALANGGAFLTERVANPFADYFRGAGGLLGQATIPRMQLLKPFPQFAAFNAANAFGGSLNVFRPHVGDSIYHAATLRIERRFTKGLSLNAHYTWSKLLDNGTIGNGAAFQDPGALRDIYNTRLERAVGTFNVPNRLVIFYSVDIPVGKGRRFFAKTGWLNHVIGDWNLFGNHVYQSGLPINVGGPDTSRIAGASPSRASVTPGVKAALPMETSIANSRAFDPRCACTLPWFNPAAFRVTPEFV